MAKSAARTEDEAKSDSFGKAAAALQRHAKYSCSATGAANMLTLARTEAMLAVPPETFDPDPFLLACTNGTLDLRTGELREHRALDMITVQVPYAYNPTADCSNYERLVLRSVNGNADVAAFIQRALGCSMLGHNREERMFVLWGAARCGKSKLVEIAQTVIAGYGVRGSRDLLTKPPAGRERHTDVTAAIRGARLVNVAEPNSSVSLDEAQVKELTGETVVRTRQSYEAGQQTTPVTWTIWVTTNDPPKVDNFDPAIRERIVAIRCGPTVPPDERDPDLLQRILQEEAEGVLTWMVRGCLEYQRQGLSPPAEVIAGTAAFERTTSPVAQFLDERCVVRPDARVKRAALRRAYEEWWFDTFRNRRVEPGRNAFHEQVEMFTDARSSTNRVDLYGVGIAVEEDEK